jgi:hypothetical protein
VGGKLFPLERHFEQKQKAEWISCAVGIERHAIFSIHKPCMENMLATNFTLNLHLSFLIKLVNHIPECVIYVHV